MQYSYLDQCVDLLKTPVDRLSPGHPQESTLLESEENIAEFFVEPFGNELENNLVVNTTVEQKADIVKLYVSRLMKSKNHVSFTASKPDLHANLSKKGINDRAPVLNKIGNLLVLDNSHLPDHDLKFMKGCNILYHLLFAELQKCCGIYEIPFTDICLKLGFPTDTINIQYPSLNNLNLPRQVFDIPIGSFEILKLALYENGFLNLPKVSVLNEQSKDELIKLVYSNDVPYKIAMFDFLGFIHYYQSEFAATKTEMYKKVAEIICAGKKPVSARTIQGNINDLLKSSSNRDTRYTASLHKEDVKKHYETLR
ncbi:MAG: hypothetical protein NT040_13125 [Bacteroidetes bacterium]|nr:hypothetical protein [Bacteroidota bacterium]